MFQFPRFAPAPIMRVTGSRPPGFPIRTSAGHRAFAPHRGFSQLVTSFFASGSQRHPPCALGSLSCSRTTRAQLKRALDLALYLLQTCVTPKDHAADQSVCSYQFFRSICFETASKFVSRSQHVNERVSCFFLVVPGRLELPTSTLSV